MTLTTPQNVAIEICDTINDLSALRYLRFNQAWARENGLGTDIYDADSHLVRLAVFLRKRELEACDSEITNLLLGLENLAGADEAYPERPETQHLQAAVLAPLVLTIGSARCDDVSAAGLRRTHDALLASGISQGQLAKAVEDSKKNFKPN